MKISSLALATSLVLFASASEAFQPIYKNINNGVLLTKSSYSSSLLHASTTDTTTSSAAAASDVVDRTYTDLGLVNPPISLFGKGRGGASSDDKHLFGGKGANLAEMSHIGLAVPPGFTITTECCSQFCGAWSQSLPPELWKGVLESVKTIEDAMGGAHFGSETNPLLLSVRSGAAISMPGMMDTVLNLGMNDAVVEALAAKSGNPRFAWDSYRRFLEMFGNVVLDIPRTLFEDEIDDIKYEAGVFEDAELSLDHLKEVVKRFKAVYAKMDLSFPEDVNVQLELAVGAVFRGWMGDRAVKYRQVENIRDLLGTAVNVQAMVFGNMGDTSGTGVCFTRDPNNGDNELFGEFLINAQGEDVVAGIRTPKPISELEAVMPGE
jgi:pyruvate,orthophosphate dikinase